MVTWSHICRISYPERILVKIPGRVLLGGSAIDSIGLGQERRGGRYGGAADGGRGT